MPPLFEGSRQVGSCWVGCLWERVDRVNDRLPAALPLGKTERHLGFRPGPGVLPDPSDCGPHRPSSGPALLPGLGGWGRFLVPLRRGQPAGARKATRYPREPGRTAERDPCRTLAGVGDLPTPLPLPLHATALCVPRPPVCPALCTGRWLVEAAVNEPGSFAFCRHRSRKTEARRRSPHLRAA